MKTEKNSIDPKDLTDQNNGKEDSEKSNEAFTSPLIKSMKGSFKVPSIFNYKEELQIELSKKYGL